MLRVWFLFLLLLGSAGAQELPVAIVAQTVGNCTVQRTASTPAEQAWALRLLWPQDRLLAGPSSMLIVLFLADQHLEAVDADTGAQLAFKGLVRSTPTGKVRVLKIPAPGVPVALEVPQILQGTPTFPEPDPDALQKEEVALEAWIDCLAYPPVFHAPNLQLTAYRHQFFDEKGAFLLEETSPTPVFKFSGKSAIRLTKGALYHWQVLSPDGAVVVPRYGFRCPTNPQAKRLRRFEKAKPQPGNDVQRFLIFDSLGMIDANLKLVKKMLAAQPNNPLVRQALSQLYLQRACPAHAAQAAKG